jgi:hypothetical protein
LFPGLKLSRAQLKKPNCFLAKYGKLLFGMDTSADTLFTIFSFLPIEVRAQFGRVCSKFSNLVKRTAVSKAEKFEYRKTQRAAFFERHLDRVNWNYISANSHLPTDFFRRHEDKVNWNILSGNTAVPVELLERHLHELMRLEIFNSSLTSEFFEKHPEHKYWPIANLTNKCNPEIGAAKFSVGELCSDSRVSVTTLESFRDKLMDVYSTNMSRNDVIPIEWLEKNNKIVWENIFDSRTLSLEWLEQNSAKIQPRHYWWICENETIPFEFFEAHIENVYWETLTMNESIPPEFFERHFEEIPVKSISLLAHNRNLPVEFFEKNAKKFVSWPDVLSSSKLSYEFLNRYLPYLDWERVSENESTPIEFLEEHLDELNWKCLCVGRERKTKNSRLFPARDLPPTFEEISFSDVSRPNYITYKPWPRTGRTPGS